MDRDFLEIIEKLYYFRIIYIISVRFFNTNLCTFFIEKKEYSSGLLVYFYQLEYN